MPNNTTKKTTAKKSGTIKNKKLGKGLDAIFGGDISTLIDDIEKNTPESTFPSSHYLSIAPQLGLEGS